MWWLLVQVFSFLVIHEAFWYLNRETMSDGTAISLAIFSLVHVAKNSLVEVVAWFGGMYSPDMMSFILGPSP